MNKKQIYKQLGANIKSARLSKGYTQSELADRTGVSLQFIGKIETALLNYPPAQALRSVYEIAQQFLHSSGLLLYRAGFA